MAFVKLTKSGKAILFIADTGDAYVMPLITMKSLVEGQAKAPITMLTALPYKVGLLPSQKSRMYVAEGYEDLDTEHVLSEKVQKQRDEKVTYKDSPVW